MAKVAIVTDSTAYIPKEITKELPITIVPLKVIWGDDAYSDGVDIQPEEFYQRLQTARVMPSTSQPTPMQFKEVFDAIKALMTPAQSKRKKIGFESN